MAVQGIQRAAMAVLVMAVSSSASATLCPEMMRPNRWPGLLVSLYEAAAAGPPEIARAAIALRAGQREEGLNLLAQAETLPGLPDDDLLRLPINPRFFDAVMTARKTAWELRGCPD